MINPERLAELIAIHEQQYGVTPISSALRELQALRARDGYVLVPVEPTDEILEAMIQADDDGPGVYRRIYRAMLSAAPRKVVGEPSKEGP